jgi:hypothetical protein
VIAASHRVVESCAADEHIGQRQSQRHGHAPQRRSASATSLLRHRHGRRATHPEDAPFLRHEPGVRRAGDNRPGARETDS